MCPLLTTSHQLTAGAAREAMEEAGARVQIVAPYAHLDIPVINEAYIFFLAHLLNPNTLEPGPESADLALVNFKEVPYELVGELN